MQHFLWHSIGRYKQENTENRQIFDAGFYVYDIPIDGSKGWLKRSNHNFSIDVKDLDPHSENFFIWVTNLSIIRAYNSLEILLQQTIQHKYFPSLETPVKGKKHLNKLTTAIKSSLNTNNVSTDSTNNRHLIEFIKLNSADFNKFLSYNVNVDWDTNWKDFFEFISVLRHIITHNAMYVSAESQNLVKSLGKKVYSIYFEQLSTKEEDKLLELKNGMFQNLTSDINNFAANTVKIIAEEKDLSFIGFY